MTTSTVRSPTRCVVMEEELTSVVVTVMTTAGKGRCQKKNVFIWDFVPNIGPHPPTAHVWDSTK